MALPSAPLGQMSSIQGPTYVPTVVVPGRDNLWKKALASILANVASTAATHGISNEMSRDYANEFGETPASGWEKLTQGPKVDKDEAVRRRIEKKADERLQADVAAKIGLENLRAKNDQIGNEYNAQQRELENTAQRTMDYMKIKAGFDANQADIRGRSDLERQRAQDEKDLLQAKQVFDLPLQSAQVGHLNAQSANQNALTQFSNMALDNAKAQAKGGKGGTPGGPPTAALQNFASPGSATTVADPDVQRVVDALVQNINAPAPQGRLINPAADAVTSRTLMGLGQPSQEDLLRALLSKLSTTGAQQ